MLLLCCSIFVVLLSVEFGGTLTLISYEPVIYIFFRAFIHFVSNYLCNLFILEYAYYPDEFLIEEITSAIVVALIIAPIR